MLRSITLLVGIFASLALSGQDLHYSQFFNSPLNTSPGLTGIFSGDQRYQLNYRRQWQNVPVDYLSADLAADFKIRNSKNSNFIGIGALINYDKAGDLSLNLTEFNGLLSYNFILNQKHVITPGVSVSYLQRRYDSGDARTGNQWDGLAYNPSFPPEFIGEESLSYIDFGAGLNYRFQKSYRTHFDIGVGLQNLTSPSDSFNSSPDNNSTRPSLLTLYGMLHQKVSNDIDIIFNAIYAKQDVYNELVINGQAKIYFGSLKDKALYLGIGYRNKDAWYPMIGLDYGQFYGAFSYDMNISDFDVATDGRGGPELSIRYIFSKIPDGPFKPCPIY